MPFGHSSPVLTERRIYLTAVRDERLVTIALDRRSGRILWERRSAAAANREARQPQRPGRRRAPRSTAATSTSSSPTSAWSPTTGDGTERWRVPLGPFNNIYGMGASPVLVDDLVVLVCDQSTSSFIVALDKTERRGPLEDAAAGGAQRPLDADPLPAEGRRHADPRARFVPADRLRREDRREGVVGPRASRSSSSRRRSSAATCSSSTASARRRTSPARSGRSRPTTRRSARYDADKRQQLAHGASCPKEHSRAWIDLDGDGAVTREEWDYYRAAMASENGMLAIRLGGRGDVTATNVVWKYHKSVPQLPSPLVYKDVLYMVNDGGIVTTLQPATGEAIAQGRVKGAIDRFYASPIAADNKVFLASEKGKIAVLPTDGIARAARRQRPGRRHLRDAGDLRRAHLPADARDAVLLRREVSPPADRASRDAAPRHYSCWWSHWPGRGPADGQRPDQRAASPWSFATIRNSRSARSAPRPSSPFPAARIFPLVCDFTNYGSLVSGVQETKIMSGTAPADYEIYMRYAPRFVVVSARDVVVASRVDPRRTDPARASGLI